MTASGERTPNEVRPVPTPHTPATVQPCTRRGGSYPNGAHPQTARVQDDDVISEFTDQGLTALNLNALRRDDDADQNWWWSYSRSPRSVKRR